MIKITKLSLPLSFLIISTVAVLPHFVTDLLAQTPQPGQVNPPLDVADSIYNANTSTFLGSKNISLTPYRMTEERFSEQGFLKGVGNVTNNQTFVNTYLSDGLVQGVIISINAALALKEQSTVLKNEWIEELHLS